MDCKDIRRKMLNLATEYKIFHISSALSTVEILVALYDHVMTENDKFIISKGHGALGLYAVLIEKGFNPIISEHPDIDVENGIECTTGSLGHGLPIGVGMALAKKLKGELGNIYVLLGDGECQEGTVWESVLLANRLKLSNIVVIVDDNKLRSLDNITIDDVANKLVSFGWYVASVDGHDVDAIKDVLTYGGFAGRPAIIIANTVKGKGVESLEGRAECHVRLLDGDELKAAYEGLDEKNIR